MAKSVEKHGKIKIKSSRDAECNEFNSHTIQIHCNMVNYYKVNLKHCALCLKRLSTILLIVYLMLNSGVIVCGHATNMSSYLTATSNVLFVFA